MNTYIPIICFIIGLAAGVVVTVVGFRLGFKASYEIREAQEEGSAEKPGLFPRAKEPGEFELLDENEKDRG